MIWTVIQSGRRQCVNGVVRQSTGHAAMLELTSLHALHSIVSMLCQKHRKSYVVLSKCQSLLNNIKFTRYIGFLR